MKRIMTVCGTGLGSSFLVEMNIQKILRELGREQEFETCHSSVYEMSAMDADYFIVANDLKDRIPPVEHLIVLESLIDEEELREKLTTFLS